eukprot:jgi/Botrbrau1/6495/Bobra.0034s0068.1
MAPSAPWDEPRCGRVRASMKTNILLQRAEIGKVKPSTFNSPAEETVFGICIPPDVEGAREVSMVWKEHKSDAIAERGPDFLRMNKMASQSGITKAAEQREFREHHKCTLKVASQSHPKSSSMPSSCPDLQAYGCPSTHRTMEQVRVYGKENPDTQQLIQGGYQWDWIQKQQVLAAREEVERAPRHRATSPTRASLGHQLATRKQAQACPDDFKMPRFRHVPAKVNVWSRASEPIHVDHAAEFQHAAPAA